MNTKKSRYLRADKNKLTFNKVFNDLLPSNISIRYENCNSHAYSRLSNSYKLTYFFKHTNAKYKIKTICPECGIIFIFDNIFSSKAKKHFCCNECRAKYYSRLKRDLKLKSVIKNTDFSGYNVWRNKYEKYATKLIYDCYPEYKDAILDQWESNAFIFYSKTVKSNKYQVLAFIKSALKFFYFHERRKRQKEVSYYDLPISMQQQILGEFNE